MFDVGFLEVLMIGVVSLVVIGPERLPAVARNVGRWVAKVQRFVRGVKADFNSELNSGDLGKLLGDQKEQIAELRKMVNDTRNDITSSTDGLMKGVQKTAGDLKSAIDATRLDDANTDTDTDTDANTNTESSASTAGEASQEPSLPSQESSPDDSSPRRSA